MTGDDAGDDVGRWACGSTALSLQVSMSEAITAQRSPPPSLPAKSIPDLDVCRMR
jgi:hypothetical protein